MPTFTDLLTNRVLAAGMLATRCGPAKRFRAATRQPMTHQLRLLRSILAENAETEFGRRHRFGAIDGLGSYRDQVPIASYDDLKPYIEKQRLTGKPCLTRAPPVMYARTSGTTAAPKFLPVSRKGLHRLSRVQRLVAQAQFAGSSLHSGRILAVVSPAIEGRFDNGLPYGSATGMIYAAMPRVIRSKYVVPPEIFGIEDYEAKYYAICALGLRDRSITGLATANPSTFGKLKEVISNHWDSLIDDIASGRCSVADRLSSAQCTAFFGGFSAEPERARELAAIGHHGHAVTFAEIWPRLSGVVTWTGGSCGFALASLADQWPERTRIVEAGYVSSEFWGSINMDVTRSTCVPTITDVFFEFVERADRESGRLSFRTLGEIEDGRQYYVLVTTSDGLYRYDMNDIVTVTGRFNETPTIAFVQKGSGVTSITGEKLYEAQVTQAFAQIQRKCRIAIPFFVAIADEEASRYRVYVESPEVDRPPIGSLSHDLDHRLGELNIEYREKRASGRLKPLKVTWIKPGTGDLYRQACVADGQRDAQFKYLQLQSGRDCRFDFARHRLARV